MLVEGGEFVVRKKKIISTFNHQPTDLHWNKVEHRVFGGFNRIIDIFSASVRCVLVVVIHC